jgi:hypothetical protein
MFISGYIRWFRIYCNLFVTSTGGCYTLVKSIRMMFIFVQCRIRQDSALGVANNGRINTGFDDYWIAKK